MSYPNLVPDINHLKVNVLQLFVSITACFHVMDTLDLIYYHSPLQVLICKSCESTFATSIRAHIRTFHKEIPLSRRQIKEYEASFQASPHISDRVVLRNLQPSAQDPAIPHLHLYLNGILCLCCDGQKQPYVCRSETHMRQHLRLVHKRQPHRPGHRYKHDIIQTWQEEGVVRAPVACQTLFKASSNRRLFPVLAPVLLTTLDRTARPANGLDKPDGKVAVCPQSSLSLEALIEENLARATSSSKNVQDAFQLQVHPTSEQHRWLQCTEWARFLAGHSLRAAVRLLDLPMEYRSDDNFNAEGGQGDRVLRNILTSLARLVERARRTMSDGKLNVFDQHRLNSFLPHRTSTKPFFHQLQDKSYQKYIKVAQKMICFVYRRAWEGTGPDLTFQLTEDQMAALTKTVHTATLLQNTLNDEKDPEHMEQTRIRLEDNLLILYTSLLDHALYGDIYESPVVGFFAVLAIQETDSGVPLPQPRLCEAVDYTPHLSAFIKISQLLVAERAILAVQRDEFDYPGLALEAMQHRFMVEGTRSPICWVQKLRAYGKAIKDTTTSIGHIHWSDDSETLSYQDTQFTMTQLRSLMATELEMAQNQLSELLLIYPDDDRAMVVPPLSL